MIYALPKAQAVQLGQLIHTATQRSVDDRLPHVVQTFPHSFVTRLVKKVALFACLDWGFSRKQLATLLGMAECTVNKYVNGALESYEQALLRIVRDEVRPLARQSLSALAPDRRPPTLGDHCAASLRAKNLITLPQCAWVRALIKTLEPDCRNHDSGDAMRGLSLACCDERIWQALLYVLGEHQQPAMAAALARAAKRAGWRS